MTELKENGQKVISEGEKCSKEIADILKKYNCTLICQKQEMYGQVIWVPTVAEVNNKT